MLKWIKLNNLALVEEAEVEFGPGFNAVTGETGAGKSVIMGAVGLLLGGRADHTAIRTGCTRCEISAGFDIPPCAAEAVSALLEEQALEQPSDGSLLLRRVITKTSSRQFINGSGVPLATLEKLGNILIDVHAANSTQSLLHESEQLAVLDRFAGDVEVRKRVRSAWESLLSLRAEKEEFLRSMPSESETERLRRDAAEIRRADPREGEDAELKNKHELAAHARGLMESAYQAEQALSGDEESVLTHLAGIRRLLAGIERIDPIRGADFLAKIEEITSAAGALSGELASYAASVELDEAEFQAMEERMRVLQTLKRRYGPELSDVFAFLQEAETKIEAFDNAASIRRDFDEREKAVMRQWQEAADELSARRAEAAEKLCGELTAETVKLGFLQAEFKFEFSPCPAGPGGQEHLRILFSANPGTPPHPLKDVASSGEISRVMLAVKTVLAEADSIPVLIFDEIDANIGGETAWTVGNELALLSRSKQVICISHLAQVARAASTHFLVSKETREGVARTFIRQLDKKSRLAEIARMLGGGKAAEAYAKDMLKSSGEKNDRRQ